MPIVDLQHVRKVYDTKVAVADLSFVIEPGTMFGLLGPNGSGKTSTIRMMIGITVPDSGAVSLFGRPFTRDALKRVGYLPEERGLYKKMTVFDQLVFLGQLHGLSAAVAGRRAKEWSERLQIAGSLDKRTEELSKGMQQKIQFIATLLHEPELIIMDEPFSGLDPVNATLLIDTLIELREAGRTILFSTHRMDQVEKMCDEIALIHNSHLILSGSMAEIKAAYARDRVQMTFAGDETFLQHPSVEHVKNYSGRAEIKLRSLGGREPDAQPLLAEAIARGTRISRFEVTEPTLEEIFIEKVGADMTASAGFRSMHNVWLIARREYLERIRTKAFLVMTILIPALMVGAIAGAALIGKRTKSNSHIALVSSDLAISTDLQTELQSGKRSEMRVDVISPPDAATRRVLNAELDHKQLDGYLWITPGATAGTRPNFAWTPKAKADVMTKETISRALRTVLTREGLTHQGMGASDVDALMQPIDLDSSQSGKDDADNAFYSAYAFFLLMYMVIMLYGMNVARSIIEEKTSRVFEVLLATIKPEEMMAGKVLGVGAVGLTQVGLWLMAAVLLTSTSLVAKLTGSDVHVPLTGMQVVFFLVYFLLGYVLYSSIAAALGAMTNSEQELQQLNMFLVLPLAACMFSLTFVVPNPDGPWATAISFIPFCTPLIMYLRISMGHPAAWQIALSIGIMLVTIYAVLWVASRIYRVGILMYGKRPNLPEIVRWLKYS